MTIDWLMLSALCKIDSETNGGKISPTLNKLNKNLLRFLLFFDDTFLREVCIITSKAGLSSLSTLSSAS